MTTLDLMREFDAESLALGAPRFRLLAEADVLALPDVAWLVDAMLPAQGSALLYGPAGIGKSFLALDLALHYASSAEEWHGRPLAETRGWVLYIAAEGAHGLKRRLRAWREGTHYDEPLAIRFLPEAVSLRSLDDPRELVEAVDALTLIPDHAPDLVVLDTLSRCMSGADENSARDASAVVAALDYLRETMGCATLAVHHTGIVETRERGSTVFRGAVDVLLSLSENDGLLTLKSEKIRDGPPFMPLHLRLVPLAGSMVLVEPDASADASRPLGKVPTAVWHSLLAIAKADGGTLTEWKESSGVPVTSFHRARKVLLDRGLVVHDGRRYKPVPSAKVPSAK